MGRLYIAISTERWNPKGTDLNCFWGSRLSLSSGYNTIDRCGKAPLDAWKQCENNSYVKWLIPTTFLEFYQLLQSGKDCDILVPYEWFKEIGNDN